MTLKVLRTFLNFSYIYTYEPWVKWPMKKKAESSLLGGQSVKLGHVCHTLKQSHIRSKII